jgi:hypothetical protein
LNNKKTGVGGLHWGTRYALTTTSFLVAEFWVLAVWERAPFCTLAQVRRLFDAYHSAEVRLELLLSEAPKWRARRLRCWQR